MAVDSRTDQVIGVCGYNPDSTDFLGILWLNWFYVRKDFIGKGVGRQLFNHVMEDIRAFKTRKLYLDNTSVPDFDRGRAFYEKNGFKLEGRFENYYDNEIDALFYALEVTYE